MCVCVRERERDRERDRARDGGGGRDGLEGEEFVSCTSIFVC